MTSCVVELRSSLGKSGLMGLAEAAEEVSATSPSKIAKGLSSSIASSTEVNLILSIIFSRGSALFEKNMVNNKAQN